MDGTTGKEHSHANHHQNCYDEEYTQQDMPDGHHDRLQTAGFWCVRFAGLKHVTTYCAFSELACVGERDVLLASWTKSHWPVHKYLTGNRGRVPQAENVVTSLSGQKHADGSSRCIRMQEAAEARDIQRSGDSTRHPHTTATCWLRRDQIP